MRRRPAIGLGIGTVEDETKTLTRAVAACRNKGGEAVRTRSATIDFKRQPGSDSP